MTIEERVNKNKEWLKTLKVGDEVCISNTYDIVKKHIEPFFGSIFGGSPVVGPKEVHEEICIIANVVAVLDDHSIVAAEEIFSPGGKELNKLSSRKLELYEPTDELRDLAFRLKFTNDIKNIDWKKISAECIRKIITTINEEIDRINKENK